MIDKSDVSQILWDANDQQSEQDCACTAQDVEPRLLNAVPDERAEDDCACPDTSFARVAPPLTEAETTNWQVAPSLHRAPLPDRHELVFNYLSSTGVVVLNKPARAVLDSFTYPRMLNGTASRQLAALRLLQPVDFVRSPVDSQPHTLTAWLHITNTCNLRCAYCYLAKTDETMNEATGRAALEAICRSAIRHDFQAIKLKYAGGEPTLNFQLIRALHEQAIALTNEAELGLREVVLSNGVALSGRMLDYMRDSGMRLMISLDGVGAGHDAQRAFPDGRGSFDLVVRGVDRALNRGLRPYLSITVTGYNAGGIADAVAFALDRDLLFNLNFYRDSDNCHKRAEMAVEDERLIAGMRAAFSIIEERLPRQSLIAGLLDRASFGALHDRACGAGRNYLVIDHHGRVARCQMEIGRTITDVFADDPLSAVQGEATGFQNVAVDEKEACRDCPWRYWCASGCPLLTYRVTGRSDFKLPYCNVYRALFPDVLRLEGLRLLKWKSSPV